MPPIRKNIVVYLANPVPDVKLFFRLLSRVSGPGQHFAEGACFGRAGLRFGSAMGPPRRVLNKARCLTKDLFSPQTSAAMPSFSLSFLFFLIGLRKCRRPVRLPHKLLGSPEPATRQSEEKRRQGGGNRDGGRLDEMKDRLRHGPRGCGCICAAASWRPEHPAGVAQANSGLDARSSTPQDRAYRCARNRGGRRGIGILPMKLVTGATPVPRLPSHARSRSGLDRGRRKGNISHENFRPRGRLFQAWTGREGLDGENGGSG